MLLVESSTIQFGKVITMDNISVVLWSFFNLVILVFIAFLLYKVLNKALNTKSEQEIISKLDQLIQLNQEILKNHNQTNNDKSNLPS